LEGKFSVKKSTAGGITMKHSARTEG